MPRARLKHIDAWVFDLDNTLYNGAETYFEHIRLKITEFICNYLDLSSEDAYKIQQQYYVQYGTSMAGLMAEHNMDPTDYLHYVHDVDPGMLKVDPRLHQGLSSLPGRKFIFTNGSRAHAKNVGEHLGIYDLFDGVFAIEDTGYISKPHHSPYQDFITAFDIDPKRAFMAEDSARNLQVPKSIGMSTLLVTSETHGNPAPKESRTARDHDMPDFIDMHTDDLPAWLLALR